MKQMVVSGGRISGSGSKIYERRSFIISPLILRCGHLVAVSFLECTRSRKSMVQMMSLRLSRTSVPTSSGKASQKLSDSDLFNPAAAGLPMVACPSGSALTGLKMLYPVGLRQRRRLIVGRMIPLSELQSGTEGSRRLILGSDEEMNESGFRRLADRRCRCAFS